jgi:hypothetical protein
MYLFRRLQKAFIYFFKPLFTNTSLEFSKLGSSFNNQTQVGVLSLNNFNSLSKTFRLDITIDRIK